MGNLLRQNFSSFNVYSVIIFDNKRYLINSSWLSKISFPFIYWQLYKKEYDNHCVKRISNSQNNCINIETSINDKLYGPMLVCFSSKYHNNFWGKNY